MLQWKEELAAIYRALAQELPAENALDVGTGMGVNLGILLSSLPRSYRVYSVDVDEAALEAARRRYRHEVETGRLELVRASADELPFENGFFGLEAAVTVMHHLEDRGAALAELYRVLSAGGFLVVMDWTPGSRLNPHGSREVGESMREVFDSFRERFYIEDVRIYKDYYILVGSRR